MSHETIIIYMCRYVYYVFFDTFIPTPSVHSFPCQFFITDVSIEKKTAQQKQQEVGGFNPFEKYARQIGPFSTGRDKNKKETTT